MDKVQQIKNKNKNKNNSKIQQVKNVKRAIQCVKNN